jgi:hypothetical protein
LGQKKWSFKTGDLLKQVQFIWSGMFGDFLFSFFFSFLLLSLYLLQALLILKTLPFYIPTGKPALRTLFRLTVANLWPHKLMNYKMLVFAGCWYISTSTFTNHFTLKFIFVRATLFQHHNITSDPWKKWTTIMRDCIT